MRPPSAPLTKRLKSLVKRTALWHAAKPRAFHAFCVGAPRSGTHSMSALFSGAYRTAHEPEPWTLLRKIMSLDGEQPDETRVPARYFSKRDGRLWLEMEANHLLHNFIDTLVQVFPSAKFILPVRNCYTWLDSVVNQHRAMLLKDQHAPDVRFWTEHFIFRFGRPKNNTYAPEERVLREQELAPVHRYLSYWTAHNAAVLEAVPEHRLLMLRTDQLEEELPRIASFLGISAHTLSTERSHSGKRKERTFSALTQIDSDFLKQEADRYCKPLMDRFYADVEGPPAPRRS